MLYRKQSYFKFSRTPDVVKSGKSGFINLKLNTGITNEDKVLKNH